MRVLLLVLVSVGCAKSFMVVPDAEWKTVPIAERTALDRAHAEDVARARQEHDTAQAALATARRTAAPRMASPVPATAAPGDAWVASVQQFEARKTYARSEISAAIDQWQRARIAFHEQRVALASARLDVLTRVREVERARAVDHARLGFDTYERAAFQAQLAEIQDRWYAADQRLTAAREALTRTTLRVADAKQAYAALVRTGPNAPTSVDDQLRLADWDDKPLRQQTRRERGTGASGYLRLGARPSGK